MTTSDTTPRDIIVLEGAGRKKRKSKTKRIFTRKHPDRPSRIDFKTMTPEQRQEHERQRKHENYLRIKSQYTLDLDFDPHKDPGVPDPFCSSGEDRQFYNLGDGCRHITYPHSG